MIKSKTGNLGKFIRRWAFRLLMYTPAPYLLTPFASNFSPTAQDALKERGVRPEVAEELAPGQNIRVESGIKSLILFPGLAAITWPFHAGVSIVSIDAVTMNNQSALNLTKNNIIYMNFADSHAPETYIASISNADIFDVKISQQEMYCYVLMHEIRHCAEDNKNIDSRLLREGDADFYSAIIAAREFNNPEIIRWVFNARAAKMPSGIFSDEHDVCLYLDAKLNGQNPPSIEEIDRACTEAGEFLFTEKRDKNLSSLSPLARKRVGFYKAAREYFKTPSPPKPLHARVYMGFRVNLQ